MKKKDLILTIATNYPYKKLAPFVETLYKTGFKGDLVIFYENLSSGTVRSLGKAGAKLIKFNPNEFEKRKLSVLKYRFALFYDFIKKNSGVYDKVFISDIRDVVFQEDPFSHLDSNGLTFFLESEKIINSQLNKDILVAAGGEKALRKYGRKNIICAGTTMGNTSRILEYLGKMKEKLLNADEKQLLNNLIDQGVHNLLIYSGDFKNCKLSKNFEGAVLTLGYVKETDLRRNSVGKIIGPKGEIIPVLHQYDRIPSLSKEYGFALPSKIASSLARRFKILSKIRKLLFNLPLINKPIKRFYQKFT